MSHTYLRYRSEEIAPVLDGAAIVIVIVIDCYYSCSYSVQTNKVTSSLLELLVAAKKLSTTYIYMTLGDQWTKYEGKQDQSAYSVKIHSVLHDNTTLINVGIKDIICL